MYELSQEQYSRLEQAFKDEGLPLEDYAEEVAAYLEEVEDESRDPDFIASRFHFKYCGTFESEEEAIMDWCDGNWGIRDLPELIKNHIAWDVIVDECKLNNYFAFCEVSGGIALFDING